MSGESIRMLPSISNPSESSTTSPLITCSTRTFASLTLFVIESIGGVHSVYGLVLNATVAMSVQGARPVLENWTFTLPIAAAPVHGVVHSIFCAKPTFNAGLEVLGFVTVIEPFTMNKDDNPYTADRDVSMTRIRAFCSNPTV